MVGRLRFSLVFAVLVLAIPILAACGGSSEEDDSGGDDSSPVPAAQEAYIRIGCAECHGGNGEGDGVNPKTVLAGTPTILGQFSTRVRNGRGEAMPGFDEGQITEEEIVMIWEWLRSLDPPS